MAKRLTDTDKWKKSFFRGLQAPYKVVWLYLLDECDHAGIWNVEMDVMKIRTGISANTEEILNVFKENVISFDDGKKWFIPDFIEFQYGVLDEKNRVHKSVLDLLSKYKNKGLISPLQRAKDKDKNKDKDKDKDKDKKPKQKFLEYVTLTEKEHQTLVDKHGKKNTEIAIETLNDYKQSKGAKYASDYGAINSWVIKSMKEKKTYLLKNNMSNYIT